MQWLIYSGWLDHLACGTAIIATIYLGGIRWGAGVAITLALAAAFNDN